MTTLAVVPNRASKLRSVEAARLKPSTIDQAAKEFIALNIQAVSLGTQIDEAKAKLLQMVEQHGVVPSKAEKSKRVVGDLYRVTATYGTSTSVDAQGAERLMLAMIEAGMDKKLAQELFASLFVFSPKYALAGSALKVIAGKLPKGAPRNLRHLFGQAVSVTPKSPSLKVEEKEKQ